MMKHKLIVEIDIESDDLMTDVITSLMGHCNVISVEQPLQGKTIDGIIPNNECLVMTIGKYAIKQMPYNPLKIWIEDTETGEAGEFDKVALDYEIHKFYKGNF